jgi:hypothetical protein
MAARTTTPDVVICKEAFVGTLNGVEVSCHAGDVLAADDPIVKNWSRFFAEPSASLHVEQATAAPGEQRG